MNPVNIVTIKSKKPLYRDGVEAHSIEIIEFIENGFKVVAQKDLHEVNDKVIYIQWDNCIPENDLFSSFKVSKTRRIRAIKFNFNEKDSIESVFSVGIVLPLKEVFNFYKTKLTEKNIHTLEDLVSTEIDLSEVFGIYKYEEPDTMKSGLTKGDLPSGMYKTDEDNFENIVNKIVFPINLYGTEKVDGSSMTVYVKKDENNEFIGGICSRTMEKKLEQKLLSGYIDEPNNLQYKKYYNKETGERGWFNEETNTFITESNTEILNKLTPIEKEVDDTFVKLGKPVLDKLLTYCKETDSQITIRSEICGEGLKGSGNKNNPHSKLKQQVYAYGIDDYSTGVCKRITNSLFYELCEKLSLQTTKLVFFKTFHNVEEIRNECESYFKENLIEGLVLRNETGNFSCKYMNNLYDSQK